MSVSVWWCGVSGHVFDPLTTTPGMKVSDDGVSIYTNNKDGLCFSAHNLLNGCADFAVCFDQSRRSISYDRIAGCGSGDLPYFTADIGMSTNPTPDYYQAFTSGSPLVLHNNGVLSLGRYSRRLIPFHELGETHGSDATGNTWTSSAEWSATSVIAFHVDLVAGAIDISVHNAEEHVLYRSVIGNGWIDLGAAHPFVHVFGSTPNTIRFVAVPQPKRWTRIIDSPPNQTESDIRKWLDLPSDQPLTLFHN